MPKLKCLKLAKQVQNSQNSQHSHISRFLTSRIEAARAMGKPLNRDFMRVGAASACCLCCLLAE